MNKISGKELNLLKTLEILKSNRFVSFYHFNNLSKKKWDTIKLQLRKIETQDIPSEESQGGDKEKKERTRVLPLSNSNKRIKGVTTKIKLKGAQVELLVLKSKAVVKALYPFLFYSQRCQGVEQTVSTLPLALLRDGNGQQVEKAVLNVMYSLLPERGAPYLGSANNQLGLTLNPVPAGRINSLINAFYLIEGPTLLVGASTQEGFKESARQLEKEKSLVFVGGVLENQFINHLDLKDCLKTFLPTSANLLQTLNCALMIPPLNYYSNKLLFLLQKRQKSFKEEKV